MIRTTITTVLVLGLAALLAWRLGGVVGAGVLAGTLGGATVASIGASLQHKIAKTAPKRLFSAITVGFLLKMFAALAGALAFRYVPEAAAVCDWQSFLLAFAVGAVCVMMAGISDLVRLGVLRAPVPLDEGQA
jgi:hypothetical protein